MRDFTQFAITDKEQSIFLSASNNNNNNNNNNNGNLYPELRSYIMEYKTSAKSVVQY